DEADARGAAARAGDPRVDLLRRELPAFARLRALRHLDLQVGRVRQVHARDAEASGCDLLDAAATRGVEQALDVFAALAGVGSPADAVHRDRERLVRLLRDRAVAHRARVEARDDRGDRLDLVERDRRPLPRLEAEQAAQRPASLHLLVSRARVLAEHVATARTRRVLQLEDRLGAEQVPRSLAAPLVLPAGLEALVHLLAGVLGVGARVPDE